MENNERKNGINVQRIYLFFYTFGVKTSIYCFVRINILYYHQLQKRTADVGGRGGGGRTDGYGDG